MEKEPSCELAKSVLPEPLYRALRHVFAQRISDCMLVGGTALAGYYFGHRRSDDLDLFVRDSSAHRAATLAAQSLGDLGAKITDRQSSQQFYSGSYRLGDHHFTVEVVLDPRLFEIGAPFELPDGVTVAGLPTLLRQKAATLLSRCSEKDLYDLVWLFEEFPDLTFDELIGLGAQVDAGMNAESLLISVVGASLRREACGFSLSQSADEVLAVVQRLRDEIARAVELAARKEPAPPIGELIRRLRG